MPTQQETAKILGISDRWLQRLAELGMIKRRVRGEWDAIEVAKELLAYREQEIERLKADNASLNAQLQRSDGDGANKTIEDTRRAKALADKAEMEVAEMKGQLIPADQVTDWLHTPVLIMKARLNALPARAAPLVHTASSVAAAENILREHIGEAIAELGKVRDQSRRARRPIDHKT